MRRFPRCRKRMIRLARERNKLTITATQMMESMITSPRAHARGGVGRGQRRAGRHGRGDALGRNGEREVSGGDCRGDGPHLPRGGESPAEVDAGTRIPRIACSRAWISPSPWARIVHRLPPQGKGNRGAHPVWLYRSVDVAAQLRRADLRTDARGVHPLQACPCSATSTRSCFSTWETTARRCSAWPRRSWWKRVRSGRGISSC